MSAQLSIQALVLLVALVTIGVTAGYWRSHRSQWPYTIPPMTWLVHLVIFYGLIFARFYGVPASVADFARNLDYTFWSAVIRLQAAFLILGVMTMLAYDKLIFRT